MAITNNNNSEDVLETFKQKIALDFKSNECIHVYDKYIKKDIPISTWSLAVEEGVASGNTAFDTKRIFILSLVVKAVVKSEIDINREDERQNKPIDNIVVRKIIEKNYEDVLHDQALSFATINRKK